MMMSITVLLILMLVPHFVNGYFNFNKLQGAQIGLSKALSRKVIYMSSSLDSVDAVESRLLDFSRIVSDVEGFDAQSASRLHLECILTLVKSDVQNREDHEGELEKHTFPESYSTALKFIADQTSLLKVNSSPLYSSANMISKKEGLAYVMKTLRLQKGQLLASREIVEVKRKTERMLSQLMTLIITYKSSLLTGTDKDFLYFTKIMLEKTSIHDRHFALLLFGRGILSPPYRKRGVDNSNNFYNDVESIGDLNTVIRHPMPSLTQSFKKSMAELGVSQPSSSARILYPFAVAAVRVHNTVNTVQKKKSDDWFSNESNAVGSKYENDDFTAADFRLSRLLNACMREDINAEQRREMIGSGDEVLSTLQRWICDLAATYFMNDEEGLFSTRDGLPEVVKRNTIAMELICTERTFCDGKKRDRIRFISLFQEIGNYLEIMTSLVEESQKQVIGISSPPLKVITMIKKTIAAISAIKFLPRTHPLRVGMENGGPNSFVGAFNANKKHLEAQSRIEGMGDGDVMKYNDRSNVDNRETKTVVDDDDDMWGAARPKVSISGRLMSEKSSKKRDPVVAKDDDDDDDIWAKSTLKKRNQPKSKTDKQNNIQEKSINDNFNLISKVDECLLQIIAEILKVDEAVIMQKRVKEEIDYVFSTWRRPHLLLDYYRMHNSSPEIQTLFRRFLSALFGVSGETVEDIRYKDTGNDKHFKLLPLELSARWMEGRARSGVLLPGYCDPQTLFMLGEDSNTCMSIRARQKGSNRGLLSLLLHGNVRILGSKDSHGRLTVRAVSRLLIDDETSRPVLYVENPYGGSDPNDYMEIYDQAADLGNLLELPVIYATPPPPSLYVMSAREIPATYSPSPKEKAINRGNDWMVEDEQDEEEEEEEELEDKISLVQVGSTGSSGTITKREVEDKVEKKVVVLNSLLDYTEIATYVWTDGIKDPDTGRYLIGHSPNLSRRDYTGAGVVTLAGGMAREASIKAGEGMAMGGRPAGVLEVLIGDASMTFQPAVVRPEKIGGASIAEQFKNEVSDSSKTPPANILIEKVLNEKMQEKEERKEEEEDDDDDFFGVVKSRKAKFDKVLPLPPLKPSIPTPLATSPIVNNIGDIPVFSTPLPLTAQEIADVKKNKKQRVVSVQARLAERQNYLLKKQQERNEKLEIGREKQNQMEQRWTERSEQVSSPSTRNPPSSAVDENRDSSARRGLDSSVIEREVTDTRNREIIEKAAKDIATVDPNAQTTRSREIIEKAAKDIATVDPIVQITESVDVGDGNDDDDDLWA